MLLPRPGPAAVPTVTRRAASALLVVAATLAGGSVPVDDGSADSTTPAVSTSAAPPPAPASADRCTANRDAGTITYLTGFDYSASASMIDVFVAEAKGYYDALCLDVEIVPSFSTDNYPLVAAGEAQMASGGSFSEVLAFAEATDAELVTLTVEGRRAINTLIVHPELGHDGAAPTLADLAGATIGVKAKLPDSIAVMLASVDLHEGEDYDTVLLDGFNPLLHYDLDGIDAFPGYISAEPGALERAGLPFELFDPTDYDVPGSFGVIFTSRAFLDEHPTAAQDFVRATMRGLADALADPQAAVDLAVDLINGGDNPNFLSPEGESFRWAKESQLVLDDATPGEGLAVPDLDRLQAEVDAYAAAGVGPEPPDDITASLAVDIVAGVYDDDGQLIWPG